MGKRKRKKKQRNQKWRSEWTRTDPKKALSYSTPYREARPYSCWAESFSSLTELIAALSHTQTNIECQIIYSSLHYHSFSFNHLYTCQHPIALIFTPSSPASRMICPFQGGLLLLRKRPVRVTLSLTPLFSTKSFHEFAGRWVAREVCM